MADFSEKFPEIHATLELTDRYVDLLEEGMDLAIRVGTLADSTLLARQIGQAEVVLCASPEYLASAPPLTMPEELKGHACIVDTNFRLRHKWPFKIDGQSKVFDVDSRMKINNASGARALALKGRGVVMTPSYMVTDDIAEGRLVQLLGEFTGSKLEVHAVYPSTRHLTARVRQFVDFVAERVNHLR